MIIKMNYVVNILGNYKKNYFTNSKYQNIFKPIMTKCTNYELKFQ